MRIYVCIKYDLCGFITVFRGICGSCYILVTTRNMTCCCVTGENVFMFLCDLWVYVIVFQGVFM